MPSNKKSKKSKQKAKTPKSEKVIIHHTDGTTNTMSGQNLIELFCKANNISMEQLDAMISADAEKQ